MFDINKVGSYLDYMEKEGVETMEFKGGEMFIVAYGAINAYTLLKHDNIVVIDDRRDVFIKRVVDKMLGGV